MSKYVIVYLDESQHIRCTIRDAVHRDVAALARNIPVSSFPLLAIAVNVETGDVVASKVEREMKATAIYDEESVTESRSERS